MIEQKFMPPYPLKYLAIYLVKKNFTSDQEYPNSDPFYNGQRIQYQKNISDIYGMTEIITFKDMETGNVLTCRTWVDNLYDNWEEYLMISKRIC